MFGILAVICFILAALGVEPFDHFKMLPLGLVWLTFAVLFGNWPLGYLRRIN